MKLRYWPLAILAALLLFDCLESRAREVCALTVNIVDAEGEPIHSTWAELIGPSGRVEVSKMTGPILRICDFGFGRHTLRIGTNACFPTVIEGLRLSLGVPIRLKVLLNDCPWGDGGRSGCRISLRVQDPDHRPVGGAKVSPANPKSSFTDAYGRFEVLLSAPGHWTFSVLKAGFAPSSLEIKCVDREDIEREVTLQPR